MEFVVKRTSLWDDEQPPCKEAVRRDVPHYMCWTFRTVAAANKMYPGITFEKLSGQRGVRSGGEAVPTWVVDLDTLDDLAAFVGRYGKVVVGSFWLNPDKMSIEIYDGYRE